MLRNALKTAERYLRRARNDFVVGPLANTHLFRKRFESEFSMSAIDFGDHELAFDPKDETIAAHIRLKGGYFRQETMNVFSAVKNGGVFVDIGANIGTQTVYALKFGGFDRAVCFEPEPRNLQILRTNLLLNDLTDRVAVVTAAAGADSGEAVLFRHPSNSGAHSLQYDHGDGIPVPVVRVGEALDSLGIRDIGLIWIDVEGHEAEVFRGWTPPEEIPLFLEYSGTDVTDTIARYAKWSIVGKDSILWRPIDELVANLPSKQTDLLFA